MGFTRFSQQTAKLAVFSWRSHRTLHSSCSWQNVMKYTRLPARQELWMRCFHFVATLIRTNNFQQACVLVSGLRRGPEQTRGAILRTARVHRHINWLRFHSVSGAKPGTTTDAAKQIQGAKMDRKTQQTDKIRRRTRKRMGGGDSEHQWRNRQYVTRDVTQRRRASEIDSCRARTRERTPPQPAGAVLPGRFCTPPETRASSRQEIPCLLCRPVAHTSSPLDPMLRRVYPVRILFP
jgi:hypothetical protein